FWVGSVLGFFGGFLPAPPITSDQVKLLRTDNVPSGKLPTLRDLGIEPTAAELILPTYLDAYRRGGRYSRARLA
ncbi:MAG: complex I NDUFA9 subunit family protein, partial [Alphaproteobacteria bacterium]